MNVPTRAPAYLVGLCALLVACARGTLRQSAPSEEEIAATDSFIAPRVRKLRPIARAPEDPCDPPAMASKYLAFADYRILGVTESDDVRAVIVEVRSVARQELVAEPYHGTSISVGARNDTIRFELRRVDGMLRLCGYSLEGYELGLFGRFLPDETHWSPLDSDSTLVISLLARESLATSPTARRGDARSP